MGFRKKQFNKFLQLAAVTLVLSAVILPANFATAIIRMKQIVRVQLNDPKADLLVLQKQDLDIAGVDSRKQIAELVVDLLDVEWLQRNGFTILRRTFVSGKSELDPRYLTAEKVEQSLRALSARYPQWTELRELGKSSEGRSIWALRVTDVTATPEFGKPVLLLNGMHHAREVMTPEVVMDAAEVILSEASAQPERAAWLKRNEVWLVPMLNVDGNNVVWTRDEWWRKNTRGQNGTDLNRNYPYGWNSCNGSSGSPFSETYRGESPGSEPETQVMMKLVQRIQPVFDISFHSYSEMVLYPYGCRDQYTPTHEVVAAIGHEMANALPLDDEAGFYEAGTPPEILYSADGSDLDWMYHDVQVIPYVIEVNSMRQGFQPSYEAWRDKTVAKLRPAWRLLMDRLEGSGMRGLLVGANGQPVAGSEIKIQRNSGPPFAQVYRVHTDGQFHVVLPPGDFVVEFSSPGHISQSETVAIGPQRLDLRRQLKASAEIFAGAH